MSDNEGNKSGKGWTDRQRLAYFFNLVEFSQVKLDFVNAPRPDGKSIGACRIMVDRLKGTLKEEIAALHSGSGGGGDANTTPKKGAATPRKRKAQGGKEADATPTKRGRKKKSVDEEAVDQLDDDDEELLGGKSEIKEEEEIEGAL